MSPWRYRGPEVPPAPVPWWVRSTIAAAYRFDLWRYSPLIADSRRCRLCVNLGGHFWHSVWPDEPNPQYAPSVRCQMCSARMR